MCAHAHTPICSSWRIVGPTTRRTTWHFSTGHWPILLSVLLSPLAMNELCRTWSSAQNQNGLNALISEQCGLLAFNLSQTLTAHCSQCNKAWKKSKPFEAHSLRISIKKHAFFLHRVSLDLTRLPDDTVCWWNTPCLHCLIWKLLTTYSSLEMLLAQSKKWVLVFLNYAQVWMRGCVHPQADAPRGRRHDLELKLQQLQASKWVLGTNSGLLQEWYTLLNCRAIFPALPYSSLIWRYTRG